MSVVVTRHGTKVMDVNKLRRSTRNQSAGLVVIYNLKVCRYVGVCGISAINRPTTSADIFRWPHRRARI